MEDARGTRRIYRAPVNGPNNDTSQRPSSQPGTILGYRPPLQRRFIDPQREKEHRAMGCVRCRRKATAMCFGDRATDQQADAKPLFLGRIKGLTVVTTSGS